MLTSRPKFLLFGIALLLLVSVGGAGAAVRAADPGVSTIFGSTAAQTRWSNYFPGKASLPDPRRDLALLIRDPVRDEPSPRCRQLQNEVVSELFRYGELAAESQSSAALISAKRIRENLHALEKSADACFEVVARTYIAGTLALLSPSNNSQKDYPSWTFQGRPLPDGLGITLLGASLLNRKRPNGTSAVVLLTEQRRQKMARDAMDPLWNQQRSKQFAVSAGFDCLSTQIFIDPFLSPYNEAATLIHELDHLFRDRMMGADALPKASENIAETDLRTYLLMDETLAIGLSAYYQRHLRWMSLWSSGNFIRMGHFLEPFRVKEDLSLFRRRGGPIAEIWHLLESHFGRGQVFDPASGLIFMGETMLLNHARYPNQRLNSHEADAAVMEIYRIVFRGYFPNEPFDSELASRVAPEKHDLAMAPLSLWLNRHDIYYDTNAREEIPPADWTLDGRVVTMSSDSQGSITGTRLKVSLDAFFDGLDTLFGRLNVPAPAPACALYMKALQTADLRLGSYQGARLSSGRGSGPGAFFPGETGVKGGETGVKGENSGLKPQLVRPCLDLGDEL